MKHFLLAALAALSVTAQAQEFEHVTDTQMDSDSYRSYMSTIPAPLVDKFNFQLFRMYRGTNEDYSKYIGVDLYDRNMKLEKSFTFPNGRIVTFDCFYREDIFENMSITKTLFDRDESYEYFTPIMIDPSSNTATGLQLRKDDGTVIATIDYGDGYTSNTGYSESYQIYDYYDDTNDYGIHNCYLAINLCDKDGKYITRFYSFEKGKISSTIKQVKDVHHGIKATPTLPKANELVKVDLGGIKSPRTLSVVNASGAMVTRMPLEDGQQEANVSTNGLPAGMYIIRVSDGKTETDNCKIIVR